MPPPPRPPPPHPPNPHPPPTRPAGGGGGPPRALPAKLGIEDTSSLCHPELDSGSGPCRALSVTPDRSRNRLARLALNATARACAKERGLPRRALDSTQGKPCSVALLGLAFTMAEILLSLTIIGVVAAITLPSLTGNINERTWNTQRKALYARFSQAIALMPALNGYGVLKEESSAGASDAEDTAAETFVTNGLSKVMKINNICDNEHVQDCGLNSTFTDMLGSIKSLPLTMTDLNASMTQTSYSDTTGTGSFSMLNTKAAAFETQNGESILLFYNPNCVAAMGETSNYFMQPKVCVNMVYDLNGNKGPNTTGKDIGIMTIFYPTDSIVVAPTPYRTKFLNVTDTDASRVCTQDAGSDYRIPNLSELGSMFVNNSILGLAIHYWVMGSYGQYRIPSTGAQWSVTCVKR